MQTGEEDEETVYQVRGKLFALSPQNQWKERGTGQLKLNIRRDDGSNARLCAYSISFSSGKDAKLFASVMRKEAVYTLLLNATLFKGMKCFLAQDPRYIRFSVFEDGVTTHYNLRVSLRLGLRHLIVLTVVIQVSNAKIAAELLEEINSHIP